MTQIKIKNIKFLNRISANFFSLITPLCVGIIVIIFLIILSTENNGNARLDALFDFFVKPFSSAWYFGNMLNKMGLFLIAASGSLFALKCGCFNLGGEGQIYFGGFLTSVLLQTHWNCSAYFQFIIALCIVFIFSFILGAISGILKNKFNTEELLTSFLISGAIIPVINYLISSPLRENSGNLLAMPSIHEDFKLKLFLQPSSLNASFFFSLFAVVIFILFFTKTKYGYQLGLSGKAREFAKFAGFSPSAPSVVGMGLSSGLHGLAGFFAITGTWYICHVGFSGGMGWAALAIALMARQNFSLIIPSALLYSWIQSASDVAVMSGTLVFDTAIFLQVAIFFFISANVFLLKPHKCQFSINCYKEASK